MIRNVWKDGILGAVIGDAIGVPVEFMSREELAQNPVVGVREFGTHNQPAGTWSDDSSMLIATLDSIISCKGGINYTDIMERFGSWAMYGDYSPFGEVFDIGLSTSRALVRYGQGTKPILCGGVSEYDNGNGSLMRILPICLHACGNKYMDPVAVFLVHDVSSLTHRHDRSKIGCGIYYFLVKSIINKDESLSKCLQAGMNQAVEFYTEHTSYDNEFANYSRLFNISEFAKTNITEISSTGYVVHTLEAAVWCLANSSSYKEAVLMAVNLGEDTDTVASVTGGLAGLYYGYKDIPSEWVEGLQKRQWIESLTDEINEMKNENEMKTDTL